MNKNLKILSRMMVGLLVVITIIYAGDLIPPAGPDSADSAMFSVEDLYQRLLNGTTGTKRNGPFQEPSSGPTTDTLHSLDEVMGLAPQKDDTNGVQDAGVLSGKKYWGLTGSQWGLRTGALPTETLSDANDNVPPGNYAATTLSTVDTDLVTSNIRAGVTIFGVAGNSNVVNTSSGTAAWQTVKFGKIAWVDGIELTGGLCGGTVVDPDANYSPQGRWCINGNGTVTDTTTGLVWWPNDVANYHWGTHASCAARISQMSAANTGSLNDGSIEYDWRLPTIKEMQGAITGDDPLIPGNWAPTPPVLYGTFHNFSVGYYWTCQSSTNTSVPPLYYRKVDPSNGAVVSAHPDENNYAMAVRNPY